MRTYRYLLFTFILLLKANASAALVPQAAGTESRFYTSADFSTAEYRRYIGIGFAAGVAQQVATCLAAVTTVIVMDDAQYTVPAASALVTQWPVCFVGAFMGQGGVDGNIHTLTQCRKQTSFLIHEELQRRLNKQINFATFATQYEQMRANQEVSCTACAPHEIHATYNKFLMTQLKKRAALTGYLVASLLGPMPWLFLASLIEA